MNTTSCETRDQLSPGHQQSHPSSGDEVYITGLSGNFPGADSVKDLQDNLFNKIDMVTADNCRWKTAHPDIPKRFGKINHLNKFDASFFGVHFRQAHTMDPVNRILLEKTYEAIIDAGYNPNELRHTKTGVFVGACGSESERTWFYEKAHVNGFGITGCSRAMMANRISYWLGVTGPSYTVDSACSSSLYALEHAFRAIRQGQCDAAIVAGVNLCLNPNTSLQFTKLGVLSPDGRCKSFDNKANGYARSEAVVVCFLQKAKDSRRVYAQLVHAKTNCDGYTEQGITHPSGQTQKLLLQEFYEECGVPPSSVEFIEAHGTGTQVGDPEELMAIEETFGPGRSGPLLIGAIKSNLGHTEPASGVCSLVKMCIAYDSGLIPPNLHYNSPREEVPALSDGRLLVVTDKTPWNRGMSGINNFGFGGANAHVLLKNAARDKLNHGIPTDDLPRLVCVSGRTESAVAKILDDLESRPVDVELVRLFHAIHDKNIKGHDFKGYTLLNSQPPHLGSVSRGSVRCAGARRPLWLVCAGAGPRGAGAGHLMTIPVFAAAIHKCHKALEPKGVNLTQLVTHHGPQNHDDILNSVIGSVAVQIGLIDVLKTIGIKPDYIIGHGAGELCCAYADGSFSAQQAVLAAYCRGQACLETSFNKASANVRLENRQSPELFSESARLVPARAVVVELLPRGPLQALPRAPPQDIVHIPLTRNDSEDSVHGLFDALGKLYCAGLNPQLARLYPHVPYPVSQGTPMISHLVKWDHSDDWYVTSYQSQLKMSTQERTVRMSIKDEESEYMRGHVVDGRNLYPATGYLVLVWETLAMMMGELYTQVSVVFEDIRFQRATTIPTDGHCEFIVMIQKGSGSFEIVESGESIVSGRIYAKKNVGQEYRVIPPAPEPPAPLTPHLLAKDFYKELRLRGYQYSGLFRGVIRCNLDGGRVSWVNNWVVFLDCMLQLKVFGVDTRGLYVPTRIDRLSIDADIQHNATSTMKSDSAKPSFEVRIYHNADVIRSGGVEIRGIHAAPISKREPLGVPILSKNIFMPNYGTETTAKIEDILRANIQLIDENVQAHKFKIIELVDDQYSANGLEPILDRISDVVEELPLVQAELLLVSEEPVEMPSNITVENRILSCEINTVLFVGANLLIRDDVLQQGLATLRDKCFVLSRETQRPDPERYSDRYDVITIHHDGSEYLVLFRKKISARPAKFIKITNDESFGWIDKVKEEMKEGQKVVLYSQHERLSGLLGLANCLRKEPGGESVRALLLADPAAPPFRPDLPLYRDQLDKDLVINVFQDGQWGTYRHLQLEELATVRADHAYINALTIGDLSSLTWVEGPIRHNQVLKNPDSIVIRVYCSALNFRDVMTATGRVTIDSLATGRLAQECVQGFELVGRAPNGSRVMGITPNCGIANLVECNKNFIWGIPDEWSFEEAATVPVVYLTVFYSMIIVGKLQSGESVLIHAGSGGVGQAAINVALHYGCEVFTTVGTAEKRAFIKKLFPQLKDSHIGNSRDTSFEDMVLRETAGAGVNVVLNSLSDDKLQASVRCLCYRGRFVEIGKFDINNNTPIRMYSFLKEISFHGFMLNSIVDETASLNNYLHSLLLSGIASGAVRPLTHCTFEKNEVESAFRYMAAGKHIGKVIIKIRDEERGLSQALRAHVPLDAVPRYMCHEDKVYVIVGGLGGFGLELADWLILRGARKLLLTSRRGITNGYQSSRMRAWASYGADVQISTHTVTTEQGCEEMLLMAKAMGHVDAIFNLAVVLKDCLFQNQTPETFKTSYAPKALATMHLDNLSRKHCPELRNFVVFSSVSCGRGNAGQTNYGLSNSVMERICEWRKTLGLPALAVQWGAVGDVGLVADMQNEDAQLEIGGTLQQRISSCLLALDKFLKQDAPVVSSIVVAEKKAGGSGCGNIVDAIAQIMGFNDLKMVSHQASLAELGLDSMTAVEIKQTLEREFEMFLTAQGIRTLTFAKLIELSAQREESAFMSVARHNMVERTAGLRVLMRNFGDEKRISEPLIHMPTMFSDGLVGEEAMPMTERVLFVLPGVEGSAAGLEPLCRRLRVRVCALQLGLEHPRDALPQMVDRLHQTMRPLLAPGADFWLLGYSFGSLLALSLAAKLESEGNKGIIFMLDGAPDYLYAITTATISFENDVQLLNSILCYAVDKTVSNKNITKTLMEKLNETESFDERIQLAIDMSPVNGKYSQKFIAAIAVNSYFRLKEVLDFDHKNVKKLRSRIVLLRPKENPPLVVVEENYGLDKFSEQPVAVHFLEGNHVSIIDNKDCANIINRALVEGAADPAKPAQNIVTSMVERQIEDYCLLKV